MMLGILAVRERRAADAEQIFRRVAGRDPRELESRRNLLYLLGLQLRTAEARAILWQIYRIGDDPRGAGQPGPGVAIRPARHSRPGSRAGNPRRPDPRRSLLEARLGDGLLYQGRPMEALPHLETAARSLVNDPFGRFALAECLIMLGKPVNAEEILGPVPDEPVNAAQWWLFRGRLEESTGRSDRAVTSFERAVARNPENREAHFRLGQALKRLGRRRGRPSSTWSGRAGSKERLKVVRREHQQVRRRPGSPPIPGSSSGWVNCAPTPDSSPNREPGSNKPSSSTPGVSRAGPDWRADKPRRPRHSPSRAPPRRDADRFDRARKSRGHLGR